MAVLFAPELFSLAFSRLLLLLCVVVATGTATATAAAAVSGGGGGHMESSSHDETPPALTTPPQLLLQQETQIDKVVRTAKRTVSSLAHISHYSHNLLSGSSTTSSGGGSSPLKAAITTTQGSDEHFLSMYQMNYELWNDLAPEEALYNFVRASFGQMDSFSLLAEFGILPSLQQASSDLHVAAAAGDVDRILELFHNAQQLHTAASQNTPTPPQAAADPPVQSSDDGVDASDDGDDLIGDGRKTASADDQSQHWDSLLNNLDFPSYDGFSALHYAAMMGHVDVVRILLEKGIPADPITSCKLSPLMIAAAMGHVDCMKELIVHGADLNRKHAFVGSTPLMFAAEMGQTESVAYLCAHGADVEAEKMHGGRAIHIAADTNNSGVVRILLSSLCCASIDPKLFGDTTPLYLAAQKGYVEVVRELLEFGADVDFEMPSSPPPEQLTAKGSTLSVKDSEFADRWMQFLAAGINPGSDPTSVSFEGPNGATVLHVATENNHPKVVELLLHHGVTQSDSMRGHTPLHIAAQYNRPEIAELLLHYGGDSSVLTINAEGYSALHMCAMFRTIPVARVLLARGADVNTVSRRTGVTPLDIACYRGYSEFVRLFRAYGGKSKRHYCD